MADQLLEAPVVQEAVPPAADSEVERLRAHNNTLLGEKRKIKDQLAQVQQELQQLREAQEAAQNGQLADSGEWKALWEKQNETVAGLKTRITELETALQDAQKDKDTMSLQAQVTQALAPVIINPEQLFRLEHGNFMLKDGKPIALHGGVEMTMAEYAEALRKPGSGYEHHCRPIGVAGMGAGGVSAPISSGVSANPYITRNMTAAVQLELTNPKLAERLKAEAGL